MSETQNPTPAPGGMRGRAIKIAGLLFALLLVVVLTLPWWVSPAAKLAIETGGTEALGVQTTLEQIDIGLFGGTASLDGLVIANPEGFKTPHLLSLGHAGVAVTLGSLTGDVVEIPNVTIESLDINLERGGKGYNYEQIQAHVGGSGSGSAAAGSGSGGASSGGSEEPGKRFKIGEIVIKEVRVRYEAHVAGGVKAPITFALKEQRYRDVGSEDGGLRIEELFTLLIDLVLQSIAASGNELPGEVLNGLKGGLAPIKDVVEDAKKAADAAKAALEKGKKLGLPGKGPIDIGKKLGGPGSGPLGAGKRLLPGLGSGS